MPQARVIVRTAITLGMLLGLATMWFGWVRPHWDAQRMDSLASAALASIKPGMTAAQATNALEALGLSHSGVAPIENAQGASNSETSVINSMIRHQVQPWSVVFRDIQIRVFLNCEKSVQRVEARNVFTGP